ncbi:AraC family transcriptional regulator ligand-binding domain-containing protein [Duganella sp. FT3S]|uniref:AraC family transcriptional regulator ligand-binding domain-containing protein n=1 Tax=Rugamonas fusca TaxID=2758568 RepID=A0A7W2EJH5_9BURK|nr:AraC family transcriptional regulator [Rugamonas fusca]MBA5607004.1 AraC family transcriptional regulator ligand-binding domain-containing protein [Rugamonas fusca]
MNPTATPTAPSLRARQAPSIHPVYVRLLCNTLRKRGLEVDALLAGAGLAPDALSEAAGPILFSQLLALLRLAVRQCPDPLLAIEWGRRIRANVHGNVGNAIFSSNTVRQALRTAEQLASLRCSGIGVTLREAGAFVRLELVPVVPLHGLDEFVSTVVAFTAIEVLRGLVGGGIGRVCIEYPFPSPAWAPERAAHCPCDARFDAPMLAARIPAELLEQELPTADAHAHALAMRQCQLDMRAGSAQLSERVAAWLAGHAGAYPTLDQVADHFCLSPRTLRRMLQQEGQQYQKILDQVRMDATRLLLTQSALSVDEIAAHAGYSDTSNFIRAFRRHHGQTPRQFRDAGAADSTAT